MHRMSTVTTFFLLASAASIAACSRGESGGTAGADSATGAASGSAPAEAHGDTIVRGTVTAVTDSTLTLSTSGGEVRVALVQPVKVYARNRGDLSRVTDDAFVGITSVPQPDGTQRATEIHVFPEELRGLGEGSRPMGAPAGGGNQGTMTNGKVSSSRMTNGSARMTNGAARMTNGAARMTNGAARGAAGGTVTVTYNGGSQTIVVPPDVPVTVLEATTVKLAPGVNVVVAGTRSPGGAISTSRVMLSGPQPASPNR